MGIEARIPVNPRNGRKPKPYNQTTYKKMRSAAEGFFAWIINFRRITMRYERLASTCKTLKTVAPIIIHLKIQNLERVQTPSPPSQPKFITL
jgi:transposase